MIVRSEECYINDCAKSMREYVVQLVVLRSDRRRDSTQAQTHEGERSHCRYDRGQRVATPVTEPTSLNDTWIIRRATERRMHDCV